MIKHLVMFSSGMCSWLEAKRTVARYGRDAVTLIFADVKGYSTNPYDGEDEDNYRFLDEAAANVGVPLVKITKGESVWECFFREKMMANSRFPICSVILKRELIDAWQNTHCDPNVTTLHFGINWDEAHRLDAMKAIKAPFRVESLICTEPPMLDKCQMMNLLRSEGIQPPRRYGKGYPHANCGGFCVKAGQAQFHLLLKTDPLRYDYHEKREQEFRAFVGKDVSIMKDRTGGKMKTLTMKSFRERIEKQGEFDQFEWGGCGCAVEH
jgi:hypothetical protein